MSESGIAFAAAGSEGHSVVTRSDLRWHRGDHCLRVLTAPSLCWRCWRAQPSPCACPRPLWPTRSRTPSLAPAATTATISVTYTESLRAIAGIATPPQTAQQVPPVTSAASGPGHMAATRPRPTSAAPVTRCIRRQRPVSCFFLARQ
ncbi:hypothetical protein emb_1c0643 [Coriobacteriaceae bacterium EMTCatB1]|nr:hypothetical protein emb_1c0643 [Coriobacteriaceae bacterium EMTCatB1]